MVDSAYLLRQIQLQKTIGDLKGLLACYYDPMEGSTDEYKEMSRVINDTIKNLLENCG
jgi:hypothetical protein